MPDYSENDRRFPMAVSLAVTHLSNVLGLVYGTDLYVVDDGGKVAQELTTGMARLVYEHLKAQAPQFVPDNFVPRTDA